MRTARVAFTNMPLIYTISSFIRCPPYGFRVSSKVSAFPMARFVPAFRGYQNPPRPCPWSTSIFISEVSCGSSGYANAPQSSIAMPPRAPIEPFSPSSLGQCQDLVGLYSTAPGKKSSHAPNKETVGNRAKTFFHTLYRLGPTNFYLA